MNGWPLLTILTLTPVVGGLLLLGLGKDQKRLARGLALGFSMLALILAGVVWSAFDSGVGDPQLVERHAWVPSLGVEYYVGVDGLGLVMVLLTALLVPLSLLIGWDQDEQVSLYQALVLLLQGGLFGVFTALNFFHWFLFWELSLIPAFFLIRLWGGAERRAAATQYLVYALVGSVALLLGFLALYQGHGTFDFLRLRELGESGQLLGPLPERLGWDGWSGEQLGRLIFVGILLGFAVKVPLMPFHSWLPLGYAEAPTPVTMLLTGLMSKMGLYGMLRILLPVFPGEMSWLAVPLLGLALVTIVFSAAAAYAQTDLKRMFAYSSINHLGYCLLAIFAVGAGGGMVGDRAANAAAALNGAVLQMFNHGLTAATLFGFLHLLERRTGGVRELGAFGGLRRVAPVFTGLMGVALFSSLGLPGLNNFVGEFLIFKGTFGLVPWAAVLALPGLMITAVFILGVLQSVFSGPVNERWRGFRDLNLGERAILAPALGLMLVVGVYPDLLVRLFNRTVVGLANGGLP
jgi:NADH-quinone oxidoreductase subunit M